MNTEMFFGCPHCGSELKLPPDFAAPGDVVECPACEKDIVVPQNCSPSALLNMHFSPHAPFSGQLLTITCLDCKGAGCTYCRGQGKITVPSWVVYNRGADEYQCKRCHTEALQYASDPSATDCLCQLIENPKNGKCPQCGFEG